MKVVEESSKLPNPPDSTTFLHIIEELSPSYERSEKEFFSLLYRLLTQIDGVDALNFFLVDTHEKMIKSVWQSFDGTVRFGHWEDLHQTHWAKVLLDNLSCGEPLLSSSLPLPPLTDPFQDRCFFPIKTGSSLVAFAILKSLTPAFFQLWDKNLLLLFSQQLGFLIHSLQKMDILNSYITRHQQRALVQPPIIEGALQITSSFIEHIEPIVTYLQHNTHTLRRYIHRLQEILNFQLDEIRLQVGQDGLSRVQAFAEQNYFDKITVDLDILLQDDIDGLIQLRHFLKLFSELLTDQKGFTSFNIVELIQSLLPLIFTKPFQQPTILWDSSLPSLYGNRSHIKYSLFLILLILRQHPECQSSHNPLIIKIDKGKDAISLDFQCSMTAAESVEWEEFYQEELLYIRRAMEEHQAILNIFSSPEMLSITLIFPQMFAQTLDSLDNVREFSIPFNAPSNAALELDAISDYPTSSTPIQNSPEHYKILLFGNNKRYLRSIKRLLEPRHTVLIAVSTQKSMDILSANPDLDLIFCNMQDNPQMSFELLDQLQNRYPQKLKHVCFIVSNNLEEEVEKFLHSLQNRCLPYNAISQEIEEFVSIHGETSRHPDSNDHSLAFYSLENLPSALSSDNYPTPMGNAASEEPLSPSAPLEEAPLDLSSLPEIPDDEEDDDEEE